MIKDRKSVLHINGGKISTTNVGGQDYISLTDMVRNFEGNKSLIGNWVTRKDTIQFLGIWEQLYNSNFKLLEFQEFKNSAGANNFSLSPQRWIEATNAIGIISKSGKYGGTYAQQDIAFEFATWLNPEFKLYLIKEFQRMKEEEQKGLAWDVRRLLSKVNYKIHTSAVKDVLIPQAGVAKNREGMVYADEAEMFNVIIFGKTANQWKDKNPKAVLRGENIRDHANILQLTVLSNLESLNSTMIRDGFNKAERFAKLKTVARQQQQNLMSSQEQLEALGEQGKDSLTMQDFKQSVRGLAKLPPPNSSDGV